MSASKRKHYFQKSHELYHILLLYDDADKKQSSPLEDGSVSQVDCHMIIKKKKTFSFSFDCSLNSRDVVSD